MQAGSRDTEPVGVRVHDGDERAAPKSNRWSHPGAKQPSPASEEVTGHEHLPHHDPTGDGRLHVSRACCRDRKRAGKTNGLRLHVVHVFGIMPWYPVYPEGTALGETEPE